MACTTRHKTSDPFGPSTDLSNRSCSTLSSHYSTAVCYRQQANLNMCKFVSRAENSIGVRPGRESAEIPIGTCDADNIRVLSTGEMHLCCFFRSIEHLVANIVLGRHMTVHVMRRTDTVAANVQRQQQYPLNNRMVSDHQLLTCSCRTNAEHPTLSAQPLQLIQPANDLQH